MFFYPFACRIQPHERAPQLERLAKKRTASGIGVGGTGGVVLLSRHLETFGEKRAVEMAAQLGA